MPEPVQTEPKPVQKPVTYSPMGKVTKERTARTFRDHLAVWTLVIGLIGGLAGSFVFVRFFASSIPGDKSQLVVQESSAVVNVAKDVSPAVVSITTQSEQEGLFGTDQSSEAAGTGMILTSNGLILTNNHVIAGSNSITVITSTGKQYTGTVVASNANNDYAFVKINASGLPTIALGDSAAVEVGQQVVAIGNALGQYQNTVTSGIISGEGRPVTASDESGDTAESLADLFQTDAAINPGNSGGPLANLDGQVIAMNTAVAGSAQNIGFAIPINEIKSAIASVESKGVIEQPYLGVRYIPLSADAASSFNLTVDNGAYVYSNDGSPAVVPGSPAANAGLQSGDIITKVNGVAITQDQSLTALISEHKVGDTVTLTVIRGGKTIKIKATLGNEPTSN